jgi:hypothetical protein
MPGFEKRVIDPSQSRKIAPELGRTRNANVWVHHYEHPEEEWTLSIATHAELGSQKLSLGGFRIAPDERTCIPGFSPDHEAIDLAIGMEEKVYWSRLMRVGGPLTRRDFQRIVGGKCVLQPTPDARVGQPRDFDLLDWAAACLNDCATSGGFHVTTGQDLGHGVMSDGKTQSLDYLHAGFRGSVVADTSKPTAEGNFYTLRGMLRGTGIDLGRATVGFIGCGNIGSHVLRRARDENATVLAVESNPKRRAQLAEQGVDVAPAEEKLAFVARPMDALVVNASGGSLDSATVDAIIHNETIKVICGSENLVMPNSRDADRLRGAGRVYCPTELGGMMGYLTAVEQYLSDLEGVPFEVESMCNTARQLEEPALEATRLSKHLQFEISFEQAIERLAPGGS